MISDYLASLCSSLAPKILSLDPYSQQYFQKLANAGHRAMAALDRKVGYEASLSKYTRVPQPGDLHILEAHVDLAGQSKFGSVKHGFLRALGSFRRPSLVPDVRNNFDDEIQLSRSGSYQYLRVATYKARGEPKSDPDRFCTCFLLLERHKDYQTYRRIGYAELWEDHKVSATQVDIEETLEVVIV
jgi:hypothetical protein